MLAKSVRFIYVGVQIRAGRSCGIGNMPVSVFVVENQCVHFPWVGAGKPENSYEAIVSTCTF